MARKSWDQLSDAYRARLERQGISRAQHESGASLSRARGHKSTVHERQQSSMYRGINTWISEASRMYGRDPVDVRAALEEFPRARVWAGIQLQKKAQDAYHDGRMAEARLIWEQRDRSLPDWMFYYHGYFS